MKSKINTLQTTALLTHYALQKIKIQFKAILLVSVYLILFQSGVLNGSLPNLVVVSIAMLMVGIGLAFFMEGLNLSFMPLGQIIGYEMLSKQPFIATLFVSLLLGFVATLAEPSTAVLRSSLAYIEDINNISPILAFLLSPSKSMLLIILAIGIGMATFFATLRNILGISIKTIIFILVPICLILSFILSLFNETRQSISLVWDAVCIATGPVTVPLMIAFGLGVGRLKKDNSSLNNDLGLGSVTIAGLIPIILLQIYILYLHFFTDVGNDVAYYLKQDQLSTIDSFFLAKKNIFPSHLFSSLKSVLPILTVLLVVWILFLRIRPQLLDEKYLGVLLTIFGLAFLGIGVKVGIIPLVNSLDGTLSKVLIERKKDIVIKNFDLKSLQKSHNSNGDIKEVFLYNDGNNLVYKTFDKYSYNSKDKTYTIKTGNQRFELGKNRSYKLGMLWLLAFTFGLGLILAFAEPMLATIGNALEESTAGAFKKDFLVLLVAIGLAIGLMVGMLRIIYDLPFIYFLLPIYALLLVLTYFSSDFMVNVAWDSAGASSGPITVVIIMLLGFAFSGDLGARDLFGLISITSSFPILVILGWSIINTFYEKKLLSYNANN